MTRYRYSRKKILKWMDAYLFDASPSNFAKKIIEMLTEKAPENPKPKKPKMEKVTNEVKGVGSWIEQLYQKQCEIIDYLNSQ
jgi:hypothetical protein